MEIDVATQTADGDAGPLSFLALDVDVPGADAAALWCRGRFWNRRPVRHRLVAFSKPRVARYLPCPARGSASPAAGVADRPPSVLPCSVAANKTR
jgi:hypothetical protein